MISKVLKVFYNTDNLPYKDKERTIHFPTGNAFLGASNTTEIWFYIERIGEPNNTWVAIAKLPNGKIGSVKLDTYTDTELNEPYAKLQLNTWFTQYKGDLYISLNGYDGGITLSLDQETGLYSVVGTPTIQATGSVKLSIQYATRIVGSDEVDEITLQEIYSMFGEKLDTNKGIVVIENPQVSVIGYDNGQYFYSKSDNSIYENVSGVLTPRFTSYNKTQTDNLLSLKANITYVDTQIDTRVAKTNVGDKVYGTDESGNQKTFDVDSDFISGENGIVVRRLYPNGQVIVGNPSAVNHATPKQYVDNGLNLKADKSNTYTKDQVDDLLASVKANEFQVVEELPQVGEEGIIYLVETQTSGVYEKYIYESNDWIYLGTTEIDLSDYYTKSEVDTLLGGKVDKVVGKGLSRNDFTDNDKNKLDGIESGAEVNVIDEITINNTPLVPVDKSVNIDLTGYQEKLVNGTNIKSLNNTSLLGSGNIDYDNALSDSSTNAVQNKVLKGYLDDIGNRLAILEESIISDESLQYTYLSDSAIPTNANSYPIIESAGMDNTDIKGHSFVYNQLVYAGNFEETTNWTATSGSITIYNNICSFIANAQNGALEQYNIPTGSNKVLFRCEIKTETPTTEVRVGIRNEYYYISSSSNWQTICFLTTAQPNTSGNIFVRIEDRRASGWDTIQVKNVQLFDFTKSGLDSVSTADEAIAELAKRGVNVYEYNPYNVGQIRSSKPTALISKSFNVWDEEVESGSINTQTGADISDPSQIRSKYFKVIPNTLYRGTDLSNSITGGMYFYDKNKNYISGGVSFKNTNFTTPANCYYARFRFGGGYGTAYNNDICINISNATLNGTYRPYKAPISYPLSLPVLRSAGSVQDDIKKKYVWEVDLGSLEYTKVDGATNTTFFASLPYANRSDSDSNIHAIISLSGYDYAFVGNTGMPNKSWRVAGTQIRIANNDWSSYTSQQVKNALTGNSLNYELATPTDQPAITLPENIEFEKGGSLEVTYDSTAPTPADFDFEVAVYKPIQ